MQFPQNSQTTQKPTGLSFSNAQNGLRFARQELTEMKAIYYKQSFLCRLWVLWELQVILYVHYTNHKLYVHYTNYILYVHYTNIRTPTILSLQIPDEPKFYHLNIDIVYFFSELVYFFIAKF